MNQYESLSTYMITYFIYFGEIVMCQSQCRIEMSTFAAEWSTIAKSAVSNILYQSKHFPVRYYNICGEAKDWPRIWTREFQKLHLQKGRLSIWVKILVPGLEEFLLFPVELAPCQVLSSHHFTLINNTEMFGNMTLLILVLNLSVFFSPWTSPWRKIFSKTVWPSQKR